MDNSVKNIIIQLIGQEKVDAIKALLKINVKLMQYKLKDGTVLDIKHEGETPMQGNPVMVMTPKGAQPAPDGEYELESGMKIKVTGGAVAEVAQPAPTAEQAPPAQDMTNANPGSTPAAQTQAQPNQAPQMQAPTQTVPAKKQIERKEVETIFSEMFSEMVKPYSEEIEKLKKENERLTKAGQETFKLVELIANQPDGTPAVKGKEAFKKNRKEETPADFMASLKFTPEVFNVELP